jgi:hypothetical protein
MPHPRDVSLSRGDLDVRVPDYIQGHLKWEAMREFSAAYSELTSLAHRLSDNEGGPSDKPRHPGAPHIDVPESQSLNMEQFAAKALGAARELQHALNRALVFAGGEVYDDLIDPTLLGPRVRGNFREVIVADRHRDPTTHIVGATTRIRLFMGEREPEYNRQPFVHVGTEDCPERIQPTSGSGEPILSVDVNDADLYDNEGEGDRVGKAVAKERVVRVHGPVEQPESEWQGDFAHYRWRTTLIFDWLKDEDDMPRSEDVVGATREECQANVEKTIRQFVRGGNVQPGEWPEAV